MKSTVEPVEGNKVKLSIEVDSKAFEQEVDAAFKRIAREVRIPGFRPGKAPRKLIEARIGLEAARGDAIEHAVPRFYSDAIREHDVDVIAAPEYDLTSTVEDEHLAFDAVVEVRPTVNPAGYESLRVTIDSPEVTEDEIEQQLERLREAYGQLEAVERAAEAGDHVLIDIVGARDGEPLEGLEADGYLYEVGSGAVVPELDEQLTGSSAGDDLEFTADHPLEGEDPIEFEVTVHEVREKVLPDLDDDFAAEATEFETLEELQEDLRARMTPVKINQARAQVRGLTADALAELVDEEIPESLIDSEVRNRLDDFFRRLQAQGITPDQYLAAVEGGAEEFLGGVREGATNAVKANLALRAIVAEKDIDVTDEEVEEQLEIIATQSGEKVNRVRKEFERTGQLSALRSEMRNQRGLDWLIERVELVDEDGKPVDRAFLDTEDAASEDSADEGSDESADGSPEDAE
ncbi:MAG: trigger factor [Acidimicrobiales bacterium]|nr:trigger factor [Acidimicrobiales bacterium]